MACYAALVPLVQLLEGIIHHDQYPKLSLSKHQITKSLHEKFSLLQALLDDSSFKGDEAADRLEKRIRDVSYQAQDFIEFKISKHVNSEGNTHFWKWVQKMNPKERQRGKYHDLEKVKEEVDSIVEAVMRIKKSNNIEDLQLNCSSADAGAAKQGPSSKNAIVRFDENLTTIKAQLCGESANLQIVPVVGMGGIGKTTLARSIFDDKLILYRFDVRVWVTVSQDYHIKKVLQTIRDSINLDREEFSEGELSEYIYKHLKGRRYLFIVDDIWSQNVWDDMKRLFPDDCNGSRIMLTTRLLDVADYAGTSGSLYQMPFLDEEQSWYLLREKVFSQESCPPELEDIGKMIANKCQGLPIAIVVVAGLLFEVSRTRYNWETIASNVSAAITKNDKNFSKLLSLSYDHLPHHLRPCLLYIGGFPEDYEIPVSKLIMLWVAEGFLKPSESKSLEQVAEEYLEELVKRNLVLVTKNRYTGKLKSCSIHDLLRDLCKQRVIDENFFHDPSETYRSFFVRTLDKVRRTCIYSSGWRSIRDVDISPQVHSILYFGSRISFPEWLQVSALRFKLLTVIHALEIEFSTFPVYISKLFHLRYLAFTVYTARGYRGSDIKIPPSICRLQNLQTLIVGGYISSPFQIWNMPQLRNLMVGGITLWPVPLSERSVGRFHVLQNLNTLSLVQNFKFTIEALEMIPNVKKLKACFAECSSDNTWQFYCLNNLVHLDQLEKLEIVFSQTRDLGRRWNRHWWYESPLPENFSFPRNLKKLSLCWCKLPWKDLRAVGSLPNLEVLKLQYRAVVGEEWEPVEGEFLRLKLLVMMKLDLIHWVADNSHYPSLVHIHIEQCWKLEMIPPGIGDIPSLGLIEVHRSSKVAADSALMMQEEQRSMGNDDLQVRISACF